MCLSAFLSQPSYDSPVGNMAHFHDRYGLAWTWQRAGEEMFKIFNLDDDLKNLNFVPHIQLNILLSIYLKMLFNLYLTA